MNITENPDYLTTQIITYIGNKRTLLSDIEKQILDIKKKLGKEKLVSLDLFSGSGIVSRMLKAHSSKIIANDLELYSAVTNSCYLENKSAFDEKNYEEIRKKILLRAENEKTEGIISAHYAPKDDSNILKDERVFYTRENALLIDTYRKLIDEECGENEKRFFLAPLIQEASVHVNTSGVFKGFYKNKETGIGCFGGKGKNALTRILGKITLEKPVLSNFECDYQIFTENALTLSEKLSGVDVAYLDPPYNQHPYGSNYFMLNLILKNEEPLSKSRVSGIPSDWNRSSFNKRAKTLPSMEKIISNLNAKFIIISYNSEGFVSFEEMKTMLEKYGKLETKSINYNTFRGSRNLRGRSLYVNEYLFILEKKLR